MNSRSSKPIVEVQNLSKLYRLGTLGTTNLRESLETWWSNLRGGDKKLHTRKKAEKQISPGRAGPQPDTFWGVKDISFDVRRGETIGIMGRNGAGKSTLLKLLSRITEPTSGRAVLRGRVVSLLEVGTGFHPELTGRENVFLNGTILGMRRAEIAAKFDEIVDFSEVGAFIDTPVKRYSSGMYVRLAFAVAAHLEPEILMIDEVLAVGDVAFQKKCLGKMGEVSSQHGRTVFFVSHNMGAIRSLCESAVLIDNGQLVKHGKPADVISYYLSSATNKDNEEAGQIFWNGEDEAPPGTDEVCLRGIRLMGANNRSQVTFEADKPVKVELYYQVRKRLRGARFNLSVLTQDGEIAFVATDHLFQNETQLPGTYKTSCLIPGGLLNRRNYILGVSCDIPGERTLIAPSEYLTFNISGAGNQASHYPEVWPGILCPKIEWKVEDWVEAKSAPVVSVRMPEADLAEPDLNLPKKLTCGVTITTRNRRKELEHTCQVLASLQPPPDEVIICADECNDGTVELVRKEFPQFQVIENDSNLGSIPSRNKLIRHSHCDILLSLDDDSYPVEPDFIERVRDLFTKRPRLAVATFPQRTDEWPETLDETNFGAPSFVGSYANSAAAIRREVWVKLGGYTDQFVHVYEEPDFSLRCLNEGCEVRYETGLHIRHHYTSAQRSELRNHHFHARNELWSVLMRCPMPQLLLVAAFRAARQFEYAWDRGWDWVVREPAWWFKFLAGLPECLRKRQPIAWPVYKNWMQLVREPISSEEEWGKKFAAK